MQLEYNLTQLWKEKKDKYSSLIKNEKNIIFRGAVEQYIFLN